MAFVWGVMVIGLFVALTLVGEVSAKYLQSGEYALARLSLAAICRTILPLGILVLFEYTTTFSFRENLIPVAVGYLISIGYVLFRAGSKE